MKAKIVSRVFDNRDGGEHVTALKFALIPETMEDGALLSLAKMQKVKIALEDKNG